MVEQALGTKTAREISPIKMSYNNISEQIQKLYDQIEHRAYEIFEYNGRIFGRDIEDWFCAETELLHPVHLFRNHQNLSASGRKYPDSPQKTWKSTSNRGG
jgi:hypothetical protein